MQISAADQQALDLILERFNRAPAHEPWHAGSTERMKLFGEAIQIFKQYPSEIQTEALKGFSEGIDDDFHELSLQDRVDYYNNVLNPSKRKYPNKKERENLSDWQLQCIMTQRKVPESFTRKAWGELRLQWQESSTKTSKIAHE